MLPYYVKIDAAWSVADKKLTKLDLEFNLWDEELAKVVTYKAHLDFDIDINANDLLTKFDVNINLDRRIAGENEDEFVFKAALRVAPEYSNSKLVSKAKAIALDVWLSDVEDSTFHIYGDVAVVGDVALTFGDECKLELADGASVKLTLSENIVQYWFNTIKDEHDALLKNWAIGEDVADFLNDLGIDAVDKDTTWGELLAAFNINVDAPNVVVLSHSKKVAAGNTTYDTVLGLNEDETHKMHVAVSLTINAEGKTSRLAFTYAFGDGSAVDKGIAFYPLTFNCEWGCDIAEADKAVSLKDDPKAEIIDNIDDLWDMLGSFMD